jgi:DNA helicase-2/ATP-dependent DNA helicase PcrA
VERKQNTTATARAIDVLLEGLNPAQRSAATFGIGAEEGLVPALLIAAGAGTGKTKTLAHRVARLILGGADPRRLLLLTFTRRAALEMIAAASVCTGVGSRAVVSAAPRSRPTSAI